MNDGVARSTRPAAAKGGPGRDESVQERADRMWDEMLQEVRVSQTGAQILFGFLLSVAFTPRFATLGGFDKALYVVIVVLGACATGALITPVCLHRVLSGHDVKPRMVDVAGRFVALGLGLLALTIATALLLLLRTATGHPVVAAVLSALVLGWFCMCWLLLPRDLLRRAERADKGREASAQRPSP